MGNDILESLDRFGFKGDEDYLIKITPMQLDEAFEIEKWPEDEFDIHASAFETALMQDICPDMDKLWILRECLNYAVLNGCRVSVPV